MQTQHRQKHLQKENKAIATYLKLVQGTLIHGCSICERLHFKKDIHAINNNIVLAIESIVVMNVATSSIINKEI